MWYSTWPPNGGVKSIPIAERPEGTYKGDNVTRYDYLYTDAELQAFVDPIRELLQHAKIVQLFFNNHAKSQATINAKKIELLLK
jgi:uncharacterized protein YecE (DUF72 family)